MKLTTILIVAGLTLVTFGPLAASAPPIMTAGVGTLSTEWSHYPTYNRCNQPMAVATEQVNSRLLVHIHTPTHTRTDTTPPRTETECGLSIALEPGVFVNPCQVASGRTPSPVLNPTDPYFYPINDESWSRTFTFADGGYVRYTIDWVGARDSPGRMWGYCASGSLYANFGGTWSKVDIG